MAAFFDARCPKCDKKIGWFGELVDRPPCPRCGHQIDAEKLKADAAHFDEMRRLLTTKPTPATCKRQRELAGLSVGQAAKRLGIDPETLKGIEAGAPGLGEVLAAKMAEAYGVGE